MIVLLFFLDRQGNFRLWRSKSTNELIKIKAHKEEILSMDVKGCLVATASRDGSVNLYLIDQVSSSLKLKLIKLYIINLHISIQ